MDVVKYIGLYLLKNHNVNIQGLGNLELHVVPARFSEDVLLPMSYKIELTSSSGSIDDNLANFIANNEQLSISKVINSLREFSLQAKNDLEQGKEIIIPSIGMFKELNGKVTFLINPAFQFVPSTIQATKTTNKTLEDPILGAGYYQQPQPHQNQHPQQSVQDPFFHQQHNTQQNLPDYQQAPPPEDYYEQPHQSRINWTRVFIALVILLMVIFGAYFLISFLTGNEPKKNKIIFPVADSTASIPVPANDSLPQDTSIEAMKTTPDGKGINFDVRLFAFSDITFARNKMKQLQDMGYATTYLDQTADSSFTFVLIPVENISPADTAYLMDSLRKLNVLHPQKVGIYRFR
jgi:nucleoid DNA-binding protein